MRPLTFSRFSIIVLLLFAAALAAIFLSLRLGAINFSNEKLFSFLTEGVSNFLKTGNVFLGDESPGFLILWKIRLPRILIAFLVGSGLAVSGAVFQVLLRNPLADPHLLGVSAGGALGAICAALFLPLFMLSIPVFSFAGSLFAISLAYILSKRKGALSVYTLLLIGVVLNAFFISMIIFIQSVVSADELATIFFWLLGTIRSMSFSTLCIVFILVMLGMSVLFSQARALNLFSLGEDRALGLGANIERTKRTCFISASLITGLCVAFSGLVGFVGLVVPHLIRLLFGSDHRLVLPASALAGGVLLVAADTLARTIILPQEVPVGVITAFLGAPIFLLLLKRKEAGRIF